jgi:hypothetical protein
VGGVDNNSRRSFEARFDARRSGARRQFNEW